MPVKDFNDIVSVDEKKGGVIVSDRKWKIFRDKICDNDDGLRVS